MRLSLQILKQHVLSTLPSYSLGYCIVDKLHHIFVRECLLSFAEDVLHALFRQFHHLLAAVHSRHLDSITNLTVFHPDTGKEGVAHF